MDVFKADGGYGAWMRRTMRPFPRLRTLRAAVGGDFEAMGAMQLAILRHYGLRPESSVIDAGCGVGRLAHALEGWLTGPYLGTETNRTFLRAARRSVRAANFRFARVKGLTIPAPDRSADFACFFSVFTHLLHEQTYLYLEEAKRVLAPGGRIVFSFLEFGSEAAWPAFAATVEHARNGIPRTLNVFVERTAIATWAAHLGLDVVDIRDAAEPFAPLDAPIAFESGAVQSGLGCLGQSVAVLAAASSPKGTS
ncbi:MAG TPA: class I SAM-dependent methyltransferase [Candidatus Elarobacter sp.]|nr:class I SAM-dependent methyltransferase [Candidatus Elarobacter sp.]